MTSLLKFSDTYFGNIDNINNSNKCYCENISREIKSVDVSKNIEKKSISNTLCNENIKIRINNALALANKEMLKKVKNNWNLLDDYLYDEEYSVVAGLLKDSLVVVASEKYIIIANNLKSIANRLNENCTLIEDLLFKIFDCRFLIVGISSDDWNIEKSKYISNIKNGVKYTEKKLSSESDDLNEINGKTSVDKLVELMGDNIIEYK